jgi:hypothetical protein
MSLSVWILLFDSPKGTGTNSLMWELWVSFANNLIDAERWLNIQVTALA